MSHIPRAYRLRRTMKDFSRGMWMVGGGGVLLVNSGGLWRDNKRAWVIRTSQLEVREWLKAQGLNSQIFDTRADAQRALIAAAAISPPPGYPAP